MLPIKEIRNLTGLNQIEFGKFYGIPLSTIKKWETKPDNPNYRKCPDYVNNLLEKAVRIDFKIKN